MNKLVIRKGATELEISDAKASIDDCLKNGTYVRKTRFVNVCGLYKLNIPYPCSCQYTGGGIFIAVDGVKDFYRVCSKGCEK